MIRGDRSGELDLRALPLILGVVGEVDRLDRVAGDLLVLEPARGEEPQAILLHGAAEHELVRRHDLVDLRVVGEAVRVRDLRAVQRRHRVARLRRRTRGGCGVVAVAGDERAPVVVEQRLAERAAEQVAAGLRDDVDEAAAEAAELGRHAVGRDGRLLNRVLDVDVERLAAQVLVHGHAVHQIQRLERHRAGDGVGARRARTGAPPAPSAAPS